MLEERWAVLPSLLFGVAGLEDVHRTLEVLHYVRVDRLRGFTYTHSIASDCQLVAAAARAMLFVAHLLSS